MHRITVHHLLTHTGGLADFVQEPAYRRRVQDNPAYRWTRAEQVQIGTSAGPRFEPGSAYLYSDTGYSLLGELVEQVTGEPLGVAFRRLLRFDDLGLASTYVEGIEPQAASGPPRAHQYLDGTDTAPWDPSFDLYGGGGLVSTLGDLCRFTRALVSGAVFTHPSTRLALMSVPALDQRERVYARGVAAADLAGHRFWGHTGYWGIAALHCPALDLTATMLTTGRTSETDPDLRWLDAAVRLAVEAASQTHRSHGRVGDLAARPAAWRA